MLCEIISFSEKTTNLDCQHVSFRSWVLIWCQYTFSPVLKLATLFLHEKLKKKPQNSLFSSLLPIFALLPAVIAIYSLSKWKYIFTSTAYCCVCWYRLPEGISGNWAPISLLSLALPLPSPVSLNWVFSLFSWLVIFLGGRLMPSFMPGRGTVGCRAPSDAPSLPSRKTSPPALTQHVLGKRTCREPAGWMDWGHGAGEMSCACPAAGWLHLKGPCVEADLGEGFVLSPSSSRTRAHRTIPQHPACLPAPDARSTSPFPLPLHKEFCIPTMQKSCISHSLGAARPDPDRGLQMLLQ